MKKNIAQFLFFVFFIQAIQAQVISDKKNVEAEHGMINNAREENNAKKMVLPGTEWFPEAGLGLFIHWGISSVKSMGISWPMIPGRELQNRKLTDAEIADIISKKDYNRFNNRPFLTPNTYWEMAEQFKPQNFNPEKWIKAAKEAGFNYVVFTAKHHDGFALWPSEYGNFNTLNYMEGKDLVKQYVEACRKYDMKVGLYYSPPDFYFDRDYMNFMYYQAARAEPKFPKLDADLNPRAGEKTKAEREAHYKAFKEYERGQLLELLKNYGKIDLLWFDGTAPIPEPSKLITREEIQKLQPGIVINSRMHGTGDFISFERTPPTKAPARGTWGEFCNTWTNNWTYTGEPYRSNAFILGQLAQCRTFGINYLLGIGPDSDGRMDADVYKNLSEIASWMKINGESIQEVSPLPEQEVANVPATAKGNIRYLFAIPSFTNAGPYQKNMLPIDYVVLTLTQSKKPKKIIMLGKQKPLKYMYKENVLKIQLPADLRTQLVDVVKIID